MSCRTIRRREYGHMRRIHALLERAVEARTSKPRREGRRALGKAEEKGDVVMVERCHKYGGWRSLLRKDGGCPRKGARAGSGWVCGW